MDNLTFFKKLAIPALVFALFFTLCTLNHNHNPVEIAAYGGLIVFIHFALFVLGRKAKPLTYLFDLIIMGFAVSNYFNTVASLFYFNRISIWISTIAALIYAFYDDREWSFGKQIKAILDTFFQSLHEVPTPVRGLKECGKQENGGKIIQVVIALCITVPVLAVLTALLVSADAIFGDMVEGFFENWDFSSIIRTLFRTVFLFFMWFCLLRALYNGHAAELPERNAPGFSALIGIIFTGSVSALYMLFSAVQLVALFAGEENLKLPSGYTYSEYAREGFFQLLFVSALNLLIVLICRWCFEENRAIRVCLMVISGATYIMLASSAFRLSMYVGAYGLTRLRFAAYAGLIVIAFLLAEIIISIYRSSFPLYRYGLFTALFGYLSLSLCQMDYWISKWNAALIMGRAGFFR